MSKITITGQLTLTGGQLTAKETYVAPAGPAGKALWSWGDTAFGQLADETAVDKSSPVQIGALTDWVNISSGIQHSNGIKADGTLWSWGRNSGISAGALGDGTIIDRSSPVQVGALTDWASVGEGDYHTHAVKIDGTLWAWGKNNNFGQLGDGTKTDRSSPVQIGALTDWASAVLSGGRRHSHAVKTDGTIWSWGLNNYGQLGLEDTDNRSSPVQVGSLTDWASVSGGFYFSVALKTDGSLWVWGENNDHGQLGLGDEIDRSSPVQMGSLTNWASVSVGQNHSTAIKTDGFLWAWGDRKSGALGDGQGSGVYNQSSPIQIGSLTDWAVIDAGRLQNLAVKTDGTLRGWGDNDNGQLGQEDTNNRSSPVQIGSLTTWTDISSGTKHSIALKSV